MKLHLLAIAVATTIACHAVAPRESEGPRPNLIVFLVDDLGWQDTSVAFHEHRTPGQERFRTPHVEALAARGMKFTNGYASAPVCTPTRTSLMTGRSPGQNHITYWTLHADQDTSRKHPTLSPPAWDVNGLQPGDVTLAGLLSDAGYRSIHVGKAHLGAVGTPGGDPLQLGFDVNVGGHGAGAPATYQGSRRFRKHPTKPNVWDVPGLAEYARDDVFLTELLAERAVAELESALDAEVPVFLHMAPYAVHTPLEMNPAWEHETEGLVPQEAKYATMVRSMDAALGAIVDCLERRGQLENSWIVFTSDNGGLSAVARGGERHVHNAPLRSGKGSAYEGGTRVPWIVAGPGVPAGTTSDQPVITHDLFPTLLALGDVACPTEHRSTVEGLDLSGHFRSQEPLGRRPFHWHQPHQWGAKGPGIEPFTSLRLGDDKLIWWHATNTFELYDLANDIGETTNLAPTEPERVQFLTDHLVLWMKLFEVQPSTESATGDPRWP